MLIFFGRKNCLNTAKVLFFFSHLSLSIQNFGGSVGKESTWNARDLGLIPGLGRSSGGGHGNSLQYSCLENPHGQRSLAGYSPWGRRKSNMTEWLSTAHPYLIISGPKKPAGPFSMLPINLSQTHQFVRLFFFPHYCRQQYCLNFLHYTTRITFFPTSKTNFLPPSRIHQLLSSMVFQILSIGSSSPSSFCLLPSPKTTHFRVLVEKHPTSRYQILIFYHTIHWIT